MFPGCFPNWKFPLRPDQRPSRMFYQPNLLKSAFSYQLLAVSFIRLAAEVTGLRMNLADS
jgi:hypothetical protein